MNWKLLLAGGSVAAALSIPTANADVICTACEYLETPTYLGAYDSITSDNGTYAHSDITDNVGKGQPFTDIWVFDIVNSGVGSTSANFTAINPIDNFQAFLYTADEAICGGGELPQSCAILSPGELVAESQPRGPSSWEIGVGPITPGRYAIQITGITDEQLVSAYTGQLGVVVVPAPATVALVAIGLIGIGASSRRSRR